MVQTINPSCHEAGILIAMPLIPSTSQVSPASSVSVSSSIKQGGVAFPECLIHAGFGATSSHRPSMAARASPAFSQENTQRQDLREMFYLGSEESNIIEVRYLS